MRVRKIAVCDAETDPFKRRRVPKPFVWGYYDGEDYVEFWDDTPAFVDFLKSCDVICYAHNGGRFDFHFILEHVEPYEEIMLINGRISKLPFGMCELRDSYNILPVSLAKMEKETIDYGLMEEEERYKPANKAAISKYLKSDCMNLYKHVMRFVDEYGMNLTLAGTAMKQWSKLSDWPVPKTTKEFYDLISPYYYGGRVECFESGIIEENFDVYDINSAYPYAMLEKHPYAETYSEYDGFVPNADFYKVSCISRGAFPYRGLAARNGKGVFGLQFPNDMETRNYTVSKWEYDAALDTATISNVKVLESIIFTGHVDFATYVNHFYDMRAKCKENKDDAGSLFCKLLMNSLYGKFAANPAEYKNYMIVPMDVIAGLDECGWEFSGEFGPWGLAQADVEEDRQRYYNVATGASITGYVRAMLWRAICSSEGVIYCDTDSIAVRRRGDAVVLGKALGLWKHEGTFDRAGIAGKKLYIMRGAAGWYVDENGETLYQSGRQPDGCSRLYKTASKGAKLTHAQLWHVAKGGNVKFVPEAPTFSPKKNITRLKGKEQAKAFTVRNLKFTA